MNNLDMPKAYEGLGGRIKKARESAGLVQEDLARAVGVRSGQVSLWERGVNKPRQKQVESIAEATGVSWEWLLTGLEPNPEPSESRVVYDAAYPSLDEFLASPMARGIKPEHEEELRGDRFSGGDPGVDYYVHRYNAILSRERHQIAVKGIPSAEAFGKPTVTRHNPRPNLADEHPKIPGVLKLKPTKKKP